MVGGIGPGDDPLQLTGRADVLGADAGRRQAGSARPMVLAAVSMDHRTRRWGAFSVDPDHAHCMTVVRHDDLAPV